MNIVKIVFYRKFRFMIRNSIEKTILILPIILMFAQILYLLWGLEHDYGK
jgi:hypothetical protein